MIGLLGAGLAAFGFFVHTGQKTRASKMSRTPIAVAAIRGGAEPAGAGLPSVTSDAAVEYTKVLQGNVSLAQKQMKAYNAAAGDRAREIEKVPD